MNIYLIIAVTPTYEDIMACFGNEASAIAHLQNHINTTGTDITGTIYRIDKRTLFFSVAPVGGYNS